MLPENCRVGLVGAGYIAQWHAQAIHATPGVQLAAICDRSQDAAEAFALAHGVPSFTELDQMIKAGICDVVHILTPPKLHHPLTLQCLQAGLHVMVEKPAALSVAELE